MRPEHKNTNSEHGIFYKASTQLNRPQPHAYSVFETSILCRNIRHHFHKKLCFHTGTESHIRFSQALDLLLFGRLFYFVVISRAEIVISILVVCTRVYVDHSKSLRLKGAWLWSPDPR